MPDVKLQPLLEAIRPDRMRPALEPFFEELAHAPALETSRLQAPTCYWAVYRASGRRVTFKSFFSSEEYDRYLQKLREHYADRFDRPRHPSGGWMLLPEWNAILWDFPFDPQMPYLYRCQDADWVSQLFGRRSGQPLQVEVVDYNPEIGAIFRYRKGRRIRAYGKASPGDEGRLVYDVMDRLWWSTERAAGQLRVAQPLAYVPEAGFLLQSAVGGRTLVPRRNSRRFLELAKVAGSSLALIHDSDITGGEPRTLESQVARLHESLPELELTAPGLYSTLRLLLNQMEARMEGRADVRLAPSHGDYKWNQFLHWRGRFALIDFELFCQAERWFDLGYFCAYLPPTNPEDWRDGLATEMLRRAFLESYAGASGIDLNLERIGLYEAATLAIRAMTQVWQHQGGWLLRASSLLDLALERLVSPEPRELDLALAGAV
jgi:hypothetical protein